MRRGKILSIWNLTFSCILLASLSGASARAESSRLVYHDFQQALEVARQEHRPLLLHFYTDWCGPCQRMEQTVFNSPQLEASLGGKILLVKVNAEQQPELARMYQITSYPTDQFIDPQGRVLRTAVGIASLNDYINQALQVESRYQQSRQLVLARQESGNSPLPYANLDIKLGLSAPFPEELMTLKNEKSETSGKSESTAEPAVLPDHHQPEVVYVALDGYCPVRLKKDRQWVKGEAQLTVVHNQQQYRFAGTAEKAMFEKQPELYAPRLLGCDPVIMWESDRALPGSTEFAAYYNEELYLFTSRQNRDMFKIDPQRFINLRHVLAPRDVEATLIR